MQWNWYQNEENLFLFKNTNEFFLFYVPFCCSLLVYQGYTNANIDSWGVETPRKYLPHR